MSKVFFTATKNLKGCLANFSWNTKLPRDGEKADFCVFVSLRQQTGLKKGAGGRSNGVYGKDGKSISVKLNTSELGAMLWAIESRKGIKASNGDKPFYHSNPSGSTMIDFAPGPAGYRFTVFNTPKSGEKFSISLSLGIGDTWALREWIKTALEHIHEAEYSLAVRNARKYAKSKASSGDESFG